MITDITKNKYFNIYFLFFSILFFSSVIFLYDEEKVVALCLISFITIFSFNFSKIIFETLNEKSITLKKELIKLFTEKIAVMRKLRYCWRIFLDIEDIVIDMYCWVNRKFINIINMRNIRRLTYFWKYIIQTDLINLSNFKITLKENTKLFLLNLLKKSINSNLINLNTAYVLKNISSNWNLKHLILNKLKINVLNHNKNNCETFIFLQLKSFKKN